MDEVAAATAGTTATAATKKSQKTVRADGLETICTNDVNGNDDSTVHHVASDGCRVVLN